MTGRALVIFIAAALCGTFSWAGTFVEPGRYKESPADIRIIFIDVGQGDSILIRAPLGRNVLIDGGGETAQGEDAGAERVLPLLSKNGINNLEYVILTHPHPDHAGGLRAVLGGVSVKNYRDTGMQFEEAEASELRRIAVRKGVNRAALRPGAVIDLGSGIKLEVLGPPADVEFEKTNDRSLVIKLAYAGTSVLFTGDAEMTEEKWLVENHGSELACDVLKSPHHGSYTSSSSIFLDRAAPQAVVISCGLDNPFELPHSATLAKYKSRKIRVYRTDYGGDVTLTMNGREFKIETQKKQ